MIGRIASIVVMLIVSQAMAWVGENLQQRVDGIETERWYELIPSRSLRARLIGFGMWSFWFILWARSGYPV